MDDFINYNLSTFDEIYEIYRKKVYQYLDNLQDFIIQIKQVNHINMLLSWYFLFFIDFNHILKKNDRTERFTEINMLLNCLENKILQLTSAFDKKKLDNLSKKLNMFKKTKSTKKPRKVISFFVKILLTLDIWNKKTLNQQMRLIFPTIFKK